MRDGGVASRPSPDHSSHKTSDVVVSMHDPWKCRHVDISSKLLGFVLNIFSVSVSVRYGEQSVLFIRMVSRLYFVYPGPTYETYVYLPGTVESIQM